MDQFIAEFLKEIKTLIIPNFGALTVTNEETNELMFMPYLKYDDGKLVKFISDKKNISEDESKALIKSYVEEIESKLNKGQNVEILSLGALSKNTDGEIVFISEEQVGNESKTILLEKEKTEDSEIITKSVEEQAVKEKDFVNDPISEEPSIIPIIEIVPETTLTENITEVYEEDLPLKIEVVEEKKQDVVKNIEKVSDDEKTKKKVKTKKVEEKVKVDEVEEVNTDSAIYSEEEQWKDDLEVPPLNVQVPKPKKAILEKTKKDKKRKGPVFYILLLLFILLLGSTLTIAMFYSSFEKVFPFLGNGHKTEQKKAPSEDEITASKKPEKQAESEKEPTEKAPIVEKETEKQVVEPQKTIEAPLESNMIQTSTGKVDRNKPFHIIGGAFSERSNADNYQKTLIDGGNSSTIIGQFDNLYIVSIASYSSKENAQNALKTAKDISTNAWIFQWP